MEVRVEDRLLPEEETKHVEGTYLDYAGAGVYCQSQVRQLAEDLSSGGYGNPHSGNKNGNRSKKVIEELRQAVKDHLNGADYTVVLTSGATGGLKIVGQTFPFAEGSVYGVMRYNHNSVLGIRGCCAARGGSYECHEIDAFPPSKPAPGVPSLLAAPLLCNFTGLVTDLSWCGQARERGWVSLVDAAAAFGKRVIDLSNPDNQPDFMVLSCYKAFGMPTGLGFLLIRKGSEAMLEKDYFGGGTVEAASAVSNWHLFRGGIEDRFEDGTPSFLDAATALHGLRLYEKISIPVIESRLSILTKRLVDAISKPVHFNGKPVCTVYGHGSGYGSYSCIVAFNIMDHTGAYIGYSVASETAGLNNIHIRGGCFCNPGACHGVLGITLSEAKAHRDSGHVCGDAMDIIDNKPTGALRASIGPHTTVEDIESLSRFVNDFFVTAVDPTKAQVLPTSGVNERKSPAHKVTDLFLYPVKGARCVRITGSWPVTGAGLLYDRMWCVMKDGSTAAVTRKNVPKMGNLQPEIDAAKGVLRLKDVETGESLEVALDRAEGTQAKAVNIRGRRGLVTPCGAEASRWLSRVLNEPSLQLCQCGPENLSNTSAVLIVNEQSVTQLNKEAGTDKPSEAFRPNIVVDAEPWSEDTWHSLRIGDVTISDTVPCVRCTQVNIGQTPPFATSEDSEPLKTLSRIRRHKGKPHFGVNASVVLPPGPPNDGGEASAAPTPTSLTLPGHFHLSVDDPITVLQSQTPTVPTVGATS